MTSITVVAVVLFAAMGIWQLDRAAYKQAIEERFEARLSADFLPLTQFDDLQQREYQRVILSGLYDTQRTILLDNQLSGGRAGYHVISPFILDTGRIILVNRGWVALGESRELLPAIVSPVQAGGIQGTIVKPVSVGFRMGEVRTDQNWPMVIPFVDIERLNGVFEGRLLPMMLWLSPQQDDVYERDWQPVWMAPEKSEAYAIQWFSFAIVAAILFVFLNLRKVDE